MLDDMIDYIAQVRERPVWQPIPQESRDRFRAGLPRRPTELREAYDEFTRHVAPYTSGNVHPRFMGWVHGGGTAVGMLAEMLAAGLNANLGGRDQMPIEVERQIVEWARSMFGFPAGASGIERQSRRPRSDADRSRTPDRRMGAFDVRLSRGGQR
ncbi:MAG TPA: hypothetical protein VGC27_01035, partial [Rhizomicrobium sp.]